MISQSTDELVKRIDEAVARFPIRNKGVYWLHASEWDVLKDTIERLQRELAARDKTIEALEKALHEKRMHPDYEYRTTSGQRKCWDGEPDLTKDGWELNKTTKNPDAFERFDYHEEMYWRRKRAAIDAARSEGGSHE